MNRIALLSFFLSLFLCCQAQENDVSLLKHEVYKLKRYRGTKKAEAKAFFENGIKQLEAKKGAGAAFSFRKALAEDEQFIEAYDYLAHTYRRMGKPDSALYYVGLSLEIYTKGIVALREQALAYELKKNNQEALRIYKRIAKMFPKEHDGFFGVARLMVLDEQYDNAVDFGREATKHCSSKDKACMGETHYILAIAYHYMQRAAKSKSHAKKAQDNGVVISPQMLKILGLEKTD